MKKYICPNCESRNNRPYCNECDISIPNDNFIEEDEVVYQKSTRCSACGREVKGRPTNCPHCGELLLSGTSYKTGISTVDTSKYLSDRSFTFQYIVSLIVPLFGFIMGIKFLTSNDNDELFAGKLCMIFGGISLFISTIILF